MPYTPYQERIRKSFSDAYQFIDKHKHPRTQADWVRLTDDTKTHTDPLTVSLIVSCLEEMEREYEYKKPERR